MCERERRTVRDGGRREVEREEALKHCDRKWAVLVIGHFPTFMNAALSVCAADRLILSSWRNKRERKHAGYQRLFGTGLFCSWMDGCLSQNIQTSQQRGSPETVLACPLVVGPSRGHELDTIKQEDGFYEFSSSICPSSCIIFFDLLL